MKPVMNVDARVVCVAAVTLVLLLTLVLTAAAARPWAWLGVRIRDLAEQEMDELSKRHGIKEGFGVVIVDVLDESPALRAGMKSGDIVVAFNERPVTDTRLLQRLIAAAAPESEVRLVVLRTEGRRAIPVRLASMPRDVIGERVAALFGFVLREPREPDAVSTTTAPVVAAVERGGAAERGGVLAGDVVLQINETPVISREGARLALADTTPEKSLRLVVRRGEQRSTLTLEPSPKPLSNP
jgi:S1-C subfamily serine protease